MKNECVYGTGGHKAPRQLHKPAMRKWHTHLVTGASKTRISRKGWYNIP